ncbi:MAG: hypothetical protein ACREEW_13255 [Caulobacteraceae bacterium]
MNNPGDAKTAEFLLSTATLMIGPQADVMALNPTDHSLGLVKNVTAEYSPTFVELTQGITAQTVMSVNTASQSKISAEVYEYNATNLAYGAGLDGSTVSTPNPLKSYALETAIAGGGVSVALVAGKGADWAIGNYGVLADTTQPDRIHVFKVSGIATDTLTVDAAYAIPTTGGDDAWPVATTVIYLVNSIGVGGVVAQPTFGAKIVGVMPDNGEPVTLIFPKVKITKGLSLAFQTKDFSSMPFELQPYALLPTDPFYADFGSKTWKVLRR